MFGIGGTELVIILIFGFLVLGPDKLPQIARFIGKAVRAFKEAQDKVTNVVQTEVYEPMKDVIDPIKSDIDSIKGPLDEMVKPLNDMVSPLQDLGKELKNPFASVVDGVKGSNSRDNTTNAGDNISDVIATASEANRKQSSETNTAKMDKAPAKKNSDKKSTSTMSLKVPQLKKKPTTKSTNGGKQ